VQREETEQDPLASPEHRQAFSVCYQQMAQSFPDQHAAVDDHYKGVPVAATAERLKTTADNVYQLRRRGVQALNECVEARLP